MNQSDIRLNWYDGKPCKNCGETRRYLSSSKCVNCNSKYNQQYRRNNQQYFVEYRKNNRDHEREYQKK